MYILFLGRKIGNFILNRKTFWNIAKKTSGEVVRLIERLQKEKNDYPHNYPIYFNERTIYSRWGIFLYISPEAFRLNGQYNNYFCARSCSFKHRRQPKGLRLDLFISFNKRKNFKIPSGDLFKPHGLRLNEQERAGKENLKPDRSLKASRRSGGER